MLTYSTMGFLAAADAHMVLVLVLGSLTMISVYVCFGEAIRLGFKHKTYTLPASSNYYFLAHDATFVAMFYKWFYELDHWLVKFFWFALCMAVIMEVIMLYQTIQYGHKELLPNVSKKTFALCMIGIQVAIFIMFWTVKWAMADELFQINYGVTVLWLMPWVISKMSRHGSQKGQSVLYNLGAVGIAIPYWPLTFFLDPYFRSPLWIALGAVTIIWGIINIIFFYKFPPYEGEKAKSLA